MSESTAEGESEPIGTRTRVPSGDDDRGPAAEGDDPDALVTRTRAP